MTAPLATVVVVPRERFSFSLPSLASLCAHTPRGVPLLYVDGGSPRAIAAELARICAREGFERIRTEGYLTPNQARNLALPRVRTKYVVFIDNDVLVTPGWLDALVRCAEETEAWVVGPVHCIGLPELERIHMAGGEARIVFRDGKRRLHEKHRHVNQRLAPLRAELARGACELTEFHCMLVWMRAFEKLGPLDEGLLSSREHIDLCLAVRDAGGSVWFEPDSLVTYVPAMRFERAELPYYLLRWSDAWGRSTFRHFQRKWGLDEDLERLLRNWIRPHRRAAFAGVTEAFERVLGRRLGGRLADGVAHALERVLAALARRRLEAAPRVVTGTRPSGA